MKSGTLTTLIWCDLCDVRETRAAARSHSSQQPREERGVAEVYDEADERRQTGGWGHAEVEARRGIFTAKKVKKYTYCPPPPHNQRRAKLPLLLCNRHQDTALALACCMIFVNQRSTGSTSTLQFSVHSAALQHSVVPSLSVCAVAHLLFSFALQ